MTDYAYASAESISAAHYAERSAGTLEWTDDELNRPPQPTDDDLQLSAVLRITYACPENANEPDPSGDFHLLTARENTDAMIRDACDISTHDGVFGVAIYGAETGALLAIFSCGVTVYIADER